MNILLGVITLFALLSGILAVMQAFAISRMAPASDRSWPGWLFGWWRFERVSARAGLSGEVQAGMYKRAVIACIAFVVLGLILSGWAVSERKSEMTAADLTPAKGARIPAASRIAEMSMLRLEAFTPGATMLES